MLRIIDCISYHIQSYLNESILVSFQFLGQEAVHPGITKLIFLKVELEAFVFGKLVEYIVQFEESLLEVKLLGMSFELALFDILPIF